MNRPLASLAVTILLTAAASADPPPERPPGARSEFRDADAIMLVEIRSWRSPDGVTDREPSFTVREAIQQAKITVRVEKVYKGDFGRAGSELTLHLDVVAQRQRYEKKLSDLCELFQNPFPNPGFCGALVKRGEDRFDLVGIYGRVGRMPDGTMTPDMVAQKEGLDRLLALQTAIAQADDARAALLLTQALAEATGSEDFTSVPARGRTSLWRDWLRLEPSLDRTSKDYRDAVEHGLQGALQTLAAGLANRKPLRVPWIQWLIPLLDAGQRKRLCPELVRDWETQLQVMEDFYASQKDADPRFKPTADEMRNSWRNAFAGELLKLIAATIDPANPPAFAKKEDVKEKAAAFTK